MSERPRRARVDADLRRQLGPRDEADERPLGETQALGEGRHAGRDVGGVEVAESRSVLGHGGHDSTGIRATRTGRR